MQAICYMAVAKSGPSWDNSKIIMAKFVAFCDSAKLAKLLAKCV